ncbi:hypothetical protein [Vibrio lentus]|uniref:Uncharacterized protein n=1 Tax=Vibrio lentus TaxID=136468 RepID=A0A855IWU7_9VIBR|nr:hypothetical protein [Vibrio lentus]PMM62936.1 hypothetical protein BCT50_00370 [Vibrio lentus]
MGKKSRLKRERKLSNEKNDFMKKLYTIDRYNQPIYRFFPEKWQAEALCSGRIWVSTLEACRGYEDPLQGDAEEATQTYHSGEISGGSDDKDFVEMAYRSGISIGPGCSQISIGNAQSTTKLPDAYVLCTTKDYSPDDLSETFGKYCVRISNPAEFFKLASVALNNHSAISDGAMGLVQYKDRSYKGMESPPGPIGFVKPCDKYAPQKEFRMLWIPKESKALTPFLLNCTDVSSLCSEV